MINLLMFLLLFSKPLLSNENIREITQRISLKNSKLEAKTNLSGVFTVASVNQIKRFKTAFLVQGDFDSINTLFIKFLNIQNKFINKKIQNPYLFKTELISNYLKNLFNIYFDLKNEELKMLFKRLFFSILKNGEANLIDGRNIIAVISRDIFSVDFIKTSFIEDIKLNNGIKSLLLEQYIISLNDNVDSKDAFIEAGLTEENLKLANRLSNIITESNIIDNESFKESRDNEKVKKLELLMKEANEVSLLLNNSKSKNISFIKYLGNVLSIKHSKLIVELVTLFIHSNTSLQMNKIKNIALTFPMIELKTDLENKFKPDTYLFRSLAKDSHKTFFYRVLLENLYNAIIFENYISVSRSSREEQFYLKDITGHYRHDHNLLMDVLLKNKEVISDHEVNYLLDIIRINFDKEYIIRLDINYPNLSFNHLNDNKLLYFHTVFQIYSNMIYFINQKDELSSETKKYILSKELDKYLVVNNNKINNEIKMFINKKLIDMISLPNDLNIEFLPIVVENDEDFVKLFRYRFDDISYEQLVTNLEKTFKLIDLFYKEGKNIKEKKMIMKKIIKKYFLNRPINTSELLSIEHKLFNKRLRKILSIKDYLEIRSNEILPDSFINRFKSKCLVFTKMLFL